MAVFKPGIGATFAGALTVTTGGAAITGTLAVTGAATVSSTLAVTGLAGFGAANSSGAQIDVRAAIANYALDVRNSSASGFGVSFAGGTTTSAVAVFNDKDNALVLRVQANGHLQFGGTTSSFVSLLRSGTTLRVRLADDSDYGSMQMAGLTATTGAFSGAVSLGNTVNSVSPTSPNRTVTISIGGTTYYLHAKTSND